MQTEIVAADVNLWWIGKVDADVFAAWGQVGGAIATFLAVVVATWIAIRDGRRSRREAEIAEAERARAEIERFRAETDRERAEEERNHFIKNQARLVTIKVTPKPVSTSTAHEYATEYDITASNHGERAIFDVKVDEADATISYMTQPGSTSIEDFALERGMFLANTQIKLETLTSGSSVNLQSAVALWDTPTTDAVEHISISYSFTDYHGRRWQRTDSSEPQITSSNPPADGAKISGD